MARQTVGLALLTFTWLLVPENQVIGQGPRAERASWYQEAKLGVCLHWGLFSVLGDGEWGMSRQKMAPAEYRKLGKKLAPADFRPKEWVTHAKKAGAGYVIFLAKHHDGFCLFDSKLTDFTVTKATPLQRDLVREVADECRRQGIRFGVGYSILDWHHPDFLPAPVWDRDNPARLHADAASYLKYVQGQIQELCSKYGKLDLFWWDGGWHHTDEESQKEIARLNGLIRSLQPHILINSHYPNGREDFGPVEPLPPLTGLVDGAGGFVPWERSLTVTLSSSLAGPPASRGHAQSETTYRSGEELIQTLVDTTSRGGNLLLHLGPSPRGQLPAECVTALHTLGKWLETNEESIRGTVPSGIRQLGFWGRSTRRGDTLYLHVFGWPPDGVFVLPGMTADLVEAGRVRVQLLGSATVPSSAFFQPAPEPRYGVRVVGGAPPGLVPVLRLRFTRWPRVQAAPLRPGTEGLLPLGLAVAEVRGQQARLEATPSGLTLSRWGRREDEVQWEFEIPVAATYEVILDYSWPQGDATELAAAVERNEVRARLPATGGKFREHTLGRLYLAAGTQTLTLRAVTLPGGKQDLKVRGLKLRAAK